jgi:hypothetical protein
MNIKKIVTLSSIPLLLMSLQASAYFDVIEEPEPVRSVSSKYTVNPKSAQPSDGFLGVKQIGVGQAVIVNGRVFDTKIQEALPLLIPKGWRLSIDPKIGQKKISWIGGQPWINALDKALRDANLNAVVDWPNRHISVSTPNMGSSYAGVSSSQSKYKQPVKAEPIAKPWKVKSGDTVKEVLDGWTKRVKWNLDCDINLAVMANVEFKGNLRSAVSQFIEALNASSRDASTVIKYRFYAGNNYLRVWKESVK